MTAQDLINQLQKLDPNTKMVVRVESEREGYSLTVDLKEPETETLYKQRQGHWTDNSYGVPQSEEVAVRTGDFL